MLIFESKIKEIEMGELITAKKRAAIIISNKYAILSPK
jgi:hypothetical protein